MPRYREIYADLRRRIADGEWQIGDRLPDLGAFMEHYNASLNTVRRATVDLRDEGVLRISQGDGTFLAAPPQSTNDELLERLRGAQAAIGDAIAALEAANRIDAIADLLEAKGESDAR
ncbi:winged helix-turn-helix domain-containing protein [Streptacidiphilus sp. P02-A3a]|uniref:GntR family transcriptional regulator n=1 Tax=Streptacidiphilus sp. P02-A3a TaxID=2704468 RepID=UPI0015F957C8|nr:winged helix-turn-helix domain-containing protein [Streptacidiphilus sp. P02-A3a]QMU70227.1 winged helix-turn-helix transcriptional regulator [Streptacidiphilus sp. P02-A3a]QMU70317.1 winged helix-turn-helix transcriptional regulator [Streptacidiphilus sp. P02-A3a]